jgi:hypothetical protein
MQNMYLIFFAKGSKLEPWQIQVAEKVQKLFLGFSYSFIMLVINGKLCIDIIKILRK